MEVLSQIQEDLNQLHNENIILKRDFAKLKNFVENIKQDNSVIIVMDSCKELGDNVVDYLKRNLKKINTTFLRFNNNEVNALPAESVRAKGVYIIGSGSNHDGTVNDNFMAMCGMIRACRDASAKYITLICTYLPYCRSDKKDQARTPIMAKLVCDFLKEAGANRLISIDLHAAQIQGYFDGPYDNLYATKYLLRKIYEDYKNYKFLLISPDVGGIKRIQDWSNQMNNADYTFLTKSRDHNAVSKIINHELVDPVKIKGARALFIDDMIDTAGTINGAAKIAKEKGAIEVVVVVTHGLFSGNAFKYLAEDYIDKVYITNTLPQIENLKKSNKIVVVDVSELVGNAIMSCVNATSMSVHFQ